MSGSGYVERKRNENIAESKKLVADALESMAASVQTQDAAITQIGSICKKAVKEMTCTADKAKADAQDAEYVAREAKAAAADVKRAFAAHEGMTILQKIQWFFRGPLW